ncbi:MAG: DinB family protein [Acidobacteria bacterium]|nr:DinB family protein [Acidobacteriota bacterium]
MPRIVEPFLAELDQEAQTTRRVLERVPGDKLNWKPHTKSMSLGQLALHVTTIPGAVAQLLANDSFEVPSSFDQPSAQSAAELIPTLEQSIQSAKEIVGKWDDRKVMETWRLTRNGKDVMAFPRMALLRSVMLNHWYHHRGQLSVYLRLLDVPLPSIYGPSADENPFAG